MKKLMIMGGLMGFLIGIVFGLIQGVAWPALFWRASIATLTAGMVLRWCGGVWIRGLQESQAQRLAAEAEASALAAPKK